MLAGFLLLLLLTGGSSSGDTEPPDDQQMNDQSSTAGGSSSGVTEPPGDQQMYDQSSTAGGIIYDVTESSGDQQMYDQSSTAGGSIDNDPTSDYVGWYDWNFSVEPDFFDTWVVKPEKDTSCTHADIINRLSLTDKVKYSYTRPAKTYDKPTEVMLDVHLYAILDVRDKEQALVTHIWINTVWHNPFISWNSEDFCGIPFVYFPSERLWKPDIMIEEMTEKDKASQTSYLAITNNGSVYLRNGMVLVSTCRLQFYKFPFDIQSCDLTFKSISMSARDLQLRSNQQFKEVVSQEEKPYEWLIVNVKVSSKEVKNYGIKSSVLVYTITMKRRSVLYAVNFILPTLFFYCLDLASFLILDSGGEKLSFKITVLLAVTVMQLILNDILPSSSDRIPLIAVYCIGIFCLMLMSLMETILVMYLMQKDSVTQDKEQSLNEDCKDKRGKFQNCFRDNNKSVHCAFVFDVSPDEKPSALLPMVKEGSSSLPTEEPNDLQKLSDEVREVMKMLALVHSNRKEEVKPGYWTKVAKTLNTIYLILYIISSGLFLGILFACWVD